MLKISIPQRDMLSDKSRIEVVDFEIKDMRDGQNDDIKDTIYDDTLDENVYRGGDEDALVLCCYCNTVEGLQEGMEIIVGNEMSTESEGSEMTKLSRMTIDTVDSTLKMFTTKYPRKTTIPLSAIEYRTELYGKYIYFRFSERHYLAVSDAEELEGTMDIYPRIVMKYKSADGTFTESPRIPVDVVDDYTLRVQVGKQNVEDDLEWDKEHPEGVTFCPECMKEYACRYDKCPECGYDDVIYVEHQFTYTYTIEGVDEENDVFFLQSIFAGIVFSSEDGMFYSIEDGDGNIDGIKILIDTPYFTTLSSFNIYLDGSINVGNIPLSHISTVGLNHEELVRTKMINEFEAGLVNPYTEMEKDVYQPVIMTMKGEYENVFKIRYNLHFRHREIDGDNKWGYSKDANNFWNGISAEFTEENEDDDTPAMYGLGFFAGDKPYSFSWKSGIKWDNSTPLDDNIEKEMSQQSDLLGHLGFVNNDVVYQKNNLKRSFLKVSFFDTDQIGSQTLLGTSVMYLDAGDLFARYIRHGDDGGKGLEVDKEMDNKYKDEDEDSEGIRLSSQIVITDKYNSRRSSEGFYFYTYRNDNGVKPQSMYAKFEFYHAKFGVVIPMMLPYWGPHNLEISPLKKGEIWSEEEYVYGDVTNDEVNIQYHSGCSFKTFNDIREDWSDYKMDKKTKQIAKLKDKPVRKKIKGRDEYFDSGYDPNKLHKYSFVKFKYGYDKENERYVYYLDPEYYGSDATTDYHKNNELIINLYESRVR